MVLTNKLHSQIEHLLFGSDRKTINQDYFDLDRCEPFSFCSIFSINFFYLIFCIYIQMMINYRKTGVSTFDAFGQKNGQQNKKICRKKMIFLNEKSQSNCDFATKNLKKRKYKQINTERIIICFVFDAASYRARHLLLLSTFSRYLSLFFRCF